MGNALNITNIFRPDFDRFYISMCVRKRRVLNIWKGKTYIGCQKYRLSVKTINTVPVASRKVNVKNDGNRRLY